MYEGAGGERDKALSPLKRFPFSQLHRSASCRLDDSAHTTQQHTEAVVTLYSITRDVCHGPREHPELEG